MRGPDTTPSFETGTRGPDTAISTEMRSSDRGASTEISILLKATSDDGEPRVPGYLYSEVSNITLESEEYCENCLDFLVKRLEEDSAHVKLKVLKLMASVVKNGHPNFRLGLLKKSRGIQEATKFSGPPDAFCGMEPYIQTRKTAQNLLEILFNTDDDVQENQAAPSPIPTAMATTGLGSSSFQSPTGRPRMEGFGNTTTTPQKSLGENLKDSLFMMVDKMAESPTDHQREILSTLDGSTSYRAPREATLEYESPSPITSKPVQQPKKTVCPPPQHVPGRAGGGWDDNDDEPEAVLMSRSADSSSYTLADRLESCALEDYTAEETVISSYVDNTEGALLARAQLKAFLRECARLNCDKVVEFLNRRISASDSTDCVMKCLMLVEILMTSDLVNLERLTSVCKDSLVNMYNTSTGPPKSKARKLMRILEKLTSHSSIMPLDGQTVQPLVHT